ncbi:MAG: hypothetical protein KIT33_13995 [Candidatus Kapabacteria bacterium]|nr:hypothetical protein [Ignavibacteriota bacterium]MCW5886078.1 hypothetical protein [Candidatus Kapabacteria bacterium]
MQFNYKILEFSLFSKAIQIVFALMFLSFSVLLNSCEMFTTRTPEKPDIGNTSFLPPTEPGIVILNLEKALSEKNIENYMNCFHSFTDDTRNNFRFSASAEATTQFPSIFSDWRINEERRSFNSIVSALGEGTYPVINWLNRKPLQETADSAIFTSDYYLRAQNNDNSIPNEYAGRLQFTLTFRDNGLWYISRWLDFNAAVNDTVSNTWSVLKGVYYN